MSRELIFRAWNEYLERFSDDIKIYGDGTWYHLIRTIDGYMESKSPCRGDVLEQYTGLKDKNGKRIFEGDLLRLPPEDEWENKNFSSFEVFFHSNDCTPTDCGLVLGRMKSYGAVAGGYGGYKLIPKDVGRMVIIGNIHETPELLP